MSWAEAREIARAAAGPLAAAEVPLSEAYGCRLAAPMRALVPLPGVDAAAMDGYAVAGDGPWRVVGRVLAGAEPYRGTLLPGTCVEIATGAPVPARASRVVPYELARVDGLVHAPSGGRAHIRRRGEDIEQGTVVLGAGAVVTPVVLGLAAGLGYDTLAVRPRPNVVVIVTGDEVVGEGLPRSGRVRDAIGPFLPGLIEWAGGRLTEQLWLPDGQEALAAALTGWETRFTDHRPGTDPLPPISATPHLADPAERPPPLPEREAGPGGSAGGSSGREALAEALAGREARFTDHRPGADPLPPTSAAPHLADPAERPPPLPAWKAGPGGSAVASSGREAGTGGGGSFGRGIGCRSVGVFPGERGVEVVVVCGASSKGPADHLRAALDSLRAEVLVDGVAVRPGHPQLLARVPGGPLVVGLPGNPFAALGAAMTLLVPVLGGGRGGQSAALVGPVEAHRHDTRLIPVRRSARGAMPTGHDGPASLWGAALADALAVVPPGWDGEQVELIDLPQGV